MIEYIAIAISVTSLVTTILIMAANTKRAEKKDVLEMAKHLETKSQIVERMVAEETAEIQRRLAHLEGRQEERDRAAGKNNKGAV